MSETTHLYTPVTSFQGADRTAEEAILRVSSDLSEFSGWEGGGHEISLILPVPVYSFTNLPRDGMVKSIPQVSRYLGEGCWAGPW